MTLDTRLLTVGEVSAQTGLTVRTLHHYDELGLLTPRERTYAGHRRYGREDVERLYGIVALRRLGLRLDEIAAVLDGATLETVVREQIAALDERIEASRRLRTLLAGVLDTLARSERPSVDDVLRAIEVTERMEKYYTPEQREYLARRKEELGDEAIREGERAWAEVLAGLRAEMEAGTDPNDERLRRGARPHGRAAPGLPWRRPVDPAVAAPNVVRRGSGRALAWDGRSRAGRLHGRGDARGGALIGSGRGDARRPGH